MPQPPEPSAPGATLRLRLAPGASIPNNPALPAILMRGALGPAPDPAAIEALFAQNSWGGMWQYTVFPFHHYHPDAHEALAVVSGWADITLGGPDGETVRVEAGDVIVLPAGTGHCRKNSGGAFSVCGAYPKGQEDYTTLREDTPATDEIRARIAAVPSPGRDPVHGADGPVITSWQSPPGA